MTDNYTFSDIGIGELRPGAMPRRFEPEIGVGKLNEKIHKESKFADTHKNLPFSFRKPLKAKGRSAVVKCDNCGKLSHGNSTTVGIICSGCKKFSTVSEV